MTAVSDVAVLVCTRGRPELVLDAIDALYAGDTVPRECVVVDQSSSPNPTLAGRPPVTETTFSYLHRPGRGLSVARNIAIREATEEVVVLLDDDMVVERDWLAHLIAGRGASSPGSPPIITTGRVLPAPLRDGEHPLPPAALITLDVAEVYRGRQPRDVVPGANVSLPRQALLDLGLYDERLGAGSRFPSAEDNDMGLRMLDAGAEVRHIPAAVALHRARPSRNAVIAQRWAYGRGKGAFYGKHVGLADRYILDRVVADLKRRVWRAIVHIPTSLPTTAAEIVHLAGLVSGGLEWWARGNRRSDGRIGNPDTSGRSG